MKYIFCLLIVLMLSGCGKPIYGHVQSKYEIAGHPQMVGKIVTYVPPSYRLTVCNDIDGCKDAIVSQAEYDAAQAGDWHDEREAQP